ncbi:unnamed protein product, partial [Ectocarpus sp. 13 AM-2016]
LFHVSAERLLLLQLLGGARGLAQTQPHAGPRRLRAGVSRRAGRGFLGRGGPYEGQNDRRDYNRQRTEALGHRLLVVEDAAVLLLLLLLPVLPPPPGSGLACLDTLAPAAATAVGRGPPAGVPPAEEHKLQERRELPRGRPCPQSRRRGSRRSSNKLAAAAGLPTHRRQRRVPHPDQGRNALGQQGVG